MVQGIESRRKRYVSVVAQTCDEGVVRPLQVILDDEVYVIDRVIGHALNRASLKVGGKGLRYQVEISGQQSFLFFEDPRWFVEEKCYGSTTALKSA
ncbi:MAG: hypothetical protein FWE48_03625 [Coriobacteriia bacterium]|nr:hypothetical protein [Coriobacteriia bacterium]